MTHRFLLTGLFSATAMLGWLGMVALARADAKENATLPTDRASELITISPESLEACTLVTTKRVYFGYEKAALTSEEKFILNALASHFSQAPQSVIELRGYTDGMESAQNGNALGTVRSQAIAHYLEARGVPSKRIVVIATNITGDEGKSTNPEHRRVDVRVFAPTASEENYPVSAATRSGESSLSKPSKGME